MGSKEEYNVGDRIRIVDTNGYLLDSNQRTGIVTPNYTGVTRLVCVKIDNYDGIDDGQLSFRKEWIRKIDEVQEEEPTVKEPEDVNIHNII